jgi:hypothetical protein
MLLIPVISRNLAAVGWDEVSGELQVQFHNGSIYSYQSVPPEVYQGLMDAPSKGTYFAYTIRNNAIYQPTRIL